MTVAVRHWLWARLTSRVHDVSPNPSGKLNEWARLL